MSGLLTSWLTRQAERRPDAVAVAHGGERMTYGELEQASNRVARLLAGVGCRRGDRVYLLAPKSPATIAGLLGILKAGGVYVPIDPASPAARARKILEACEGRAVLAAGPAAGLLDDLLAGAPPRGPLAVGWLDAGPAEGHRFAPAFTRDDWPAVPGEPPEPRGDPGDPAYVLFTSGSTGVPKGVVITHANVRAFVEWAVPYFGMRPTDRISGHPPLTFDLSVLDIFGTLAAGAALHLVPAGLSLLPHRLAELIRAEALTQWFSVPSTLAYMAKFDVVRHGDFPALERLLWCGEVFPTPALIYFMRRLPHVAFTNLYGPTEATIASSYYTLPGCPDDERARVPIGRACPGEELLVLDEALRPVAPGEVGELYISGVGLSPGYFRDPERTREAFLPDPRGERPGGRIYRTGDLAMAGGDGLVYFAGRRDDQIKSRGYRIELGEIEAALCGIPYLREAAAVAIPTGGFEGTVVGCAYVAAGGAAAGPVRLREDLARLVPGYMLPARWLAMEALPRNANGKIDRRRLRELLDEHDPQAPRDR